jgi:putative ABC transport system permease protein
VVDGAGTLEDGEIIVDRALARRSGLSVGDWLTIRGTLYQVSGLSTGTNVVVSQFTFVNQREAELLAGIKGVTSFYLVRARPGVAPSVLAARLEAAAPALNVFTASEFTRNNLEEMQAGLLPILATVALFGLVIGGALLTLLLYSSILERREDYAVLKAIGAGQGFLRALVVRQSLATVLCGLAFGAASYVVAAPAIQLLVPVLALALCTADLVLIAAAVVVMGAVGALIPLARIERIYPAEVFRA